MKTALKFSITLLIASLAALMACFIGEHLFSDIESIGARFILGLLMEFLSVVLLFGIYQFIDEIF